MVILEYSDVEVINRWYINSIVKKKKTERVSWLIAFEIDKMFCSRGIFCKYRSDIKVESIKIKNGSYVNKERD